LALLRIERRGGIAGLVITAEIEEDSLSSEDRVLLDRLFRSRHALMPAPGADRFRYLVTRFGHQGIRKIEIPEHLVPRAVAEAVRGPLQPKES
jgi:hypothetical protein